MVPPKTRQSHTHSKMVYSTESVQINHELQELKKTISYMADTIEALNQDKKSHSDSERYSGDKDYYVSDAFARIHEIESIMHVSNVNAFEHFIARTAKDWPGTIPDFKDWLGKNKKMPLQANTETLSIILNYYPSLDLQPILTEFFNFISEKQAFSFHSSDLDTISGRLIKHSSSRKGDITDILEMMDITLWQRQEYFDEVYQSNNLPALTISCAKIASLETYLDFMFSKWDSLHIHQIEKIDDTLRQLCYKNDDMILQLSTLPWQSWTSHYESARQVKSLISPIAENHLKLHFQIQFERQFLSSSLGQHSTDSKKFVL